MVQKGALTAEEIEPVAQREVFEQDEGMEVSSSPSPHDGEESNTIGGLAASSHTVSR
jgi:hypothetical protein